ncbi:hypothetical protein [Sedimenticola selenatireducens]|uniref:Uncharacterized protein n=1 Tax=Sedimenticola selenatireducens TaxID=191960 RepID=A0A557SCJ2_9GAMM|nr:hypothetical protein [Sedimenticola selenatireducens]TVO75113.1 hypothetical protein FHP88_08860 [Sedimenticola selenatireducens]TVT67032.1 MAG: hypothetical protein FHK78_01495 [Sedimenticola selenatireducens]
MKATDITLRLLDEAAVTLRENAAHLKAMHTLDGHWQITEKSDIDAMISYAQELRLARRLTAEAARLRDEARNCFEPPKTKAAS